MEPTEPINGYRIVVLKAELVAHLRKRSDHYRELGETFASAAERVREATERGHHGDFLAASLNAIDRDLLAAIAEEDDRQDRRGTAGALADRAEAAQARSRAFAFLADHTADASFALTHGELADLELLDGCDVDGGRYPTLRVRPRRRR